MLRLSACLIIICLVSSMTCRAQENTVMGLGMLKCAVYTKGMQQDPADTEKFYFTWIFGFLTGMNISAKIKGDQLRVLANKDDQQKFINQYCDAHPNEIVGAATVALYNTFPFVTPTQAK